MFTRQHIVACILAAALALPAGACSSGTSPSTSTSYSGTFTGQMIVTTATGTTICVSTRTLNGTLKITLDDSKATLTGTGQTTGTLAEIAVAPPGLCSPLSTNVSLNATKSITGTTSGMSFTSVTTTTTPTPNGGAMACTDTIGFSGSLAAGTITGTLTYSTSCSGNSGINVIAGSGATAIPVALR